MADWVKAQGFAITQRDDTGRVCVFARGTVSQLQQGFGATFARVQFEGKEYTSAITAPNVPTNLAPLLVGVTGLQPFVHAHKHLVMKAKTTNSTTGQGAPFTPQQIAKAYNATGLYNANVTGSGQTIAIVIDTFPATSDLTGFWQACGINQSLNNVQFIQVVTGQLPATEGEETLDTEWASSIAPGAQVRVYGTVALGEAELEAAYQQILSDATQQPGLGLHQMSMSYGGSELFDHQQDPSGLTTDDNLFMELEAAGVSVCASSGDAGSTPANNPSSSIDESGSTVTPENPASDPNVTGVGGTSLFVDGNGNATSETAWGDTVSDNTANGASGGGTSTVFARPTWQTGTGVPSGTKRLVPDISCPANPQTGAEFYYQGQLVINEGEIIGGTSWSSPTVAGFLALMNQARANLGEAPVGLLNTYIYPLMGTANLRDITSGSNQTANSSGLYPAGTGYDEVTGVGSPLMQALTQTLTTSIPVAGALPAEESLAPGQTGTFTTHAGGSPVSYQWQRMPIGTTTWSNLSNGSTYGGVATPTLTISGVTLAMSGDQFQCVVTYAGSVTATTPATTMVVEAPLTTAAYAGVVGTTGTADGSAAGANFNFPSGVALDSSGNLYVADFSNNTIRKITPAGQVSTPYTGLNEPNSIVADSSNNFYIAATGDDAIYKISSSGVLSVFAGTVGTAGFNNATGTAAEFNQPNGVAVDKSGNVYVADTDNFLIRKITSSGKVTTLAGKTGTQGYVDATGTAAEFGYPAGVAVDSSGNVYVADLAANVVRKITSGGVVTTFAGQLNGTGAVDGIGRKAQFNGPVGVAIDSANNLYISDAQVPPMGSTASGNCLLRKITPNAVVSTLVGDPGVAGSNLGTGSAAQFYSPQNVVISSVNGELFIADVFNQVIRAAGFPSSIISQPVGEVVMAGQPVVLSVSAIGTATVSYQWRKNGANIGGATGSTFSIGSAATTDTGAYSVVVTNPISIVTSNAVSVVVAAALPTAQTTAVGGAATFSITPPGTGGPFTYQWLFNGTAIPGATGSSFTINNVSSANAGSYSVMITDSAGTVTTTPVTLTVNPALAGDTPTMPEWALIFLAALLFMVGLPGVSYRQSESR